MDVVLLLSGGIDSVTLLYYLVKEKGYGVRALSMDYGQRHKKELECIKYHIDRLSSEGFDVDVKFVDLVFIKELFGSKTVLLDESQKVPSVKEILGLPQPVTYVPFRNMIFLSIALGYAESVGCKCVYYGANKHDEMLGYWDTTYYFLKAINDVAGLNRENVIRVVAPFLRLSKGEIIYLGNKLGVNYSKTYTCYKGNEKACGVCSSCSDRIMGFVNCGIKDSIKYEREINWDELFDKYKCDFRFDEILNKIRDVESMFLR